LWSQDFSLKRKILTNIKTYDNLILEMTDREIIAKIEDYMRKHNLRQWELAKRLGIPEATLNRWLRKRANISNAYLRILQQAGII